MANTYTQIYYHIVFSTKNRIAAIMPDRRSDLYGYLWGINKKRKCHLYRVGGVEDHVHLLTSIHPTVSLARYIEDIKTGTSNWIRREKIYGAWPGWQDGYAAFTHSIRERDALIEYISGQEQHHGKESFLDELKRLLDVAGITYDPKYLD